MRQTLGVERTHPAKYGNEPHPTFEGEREEGHDWEASD